MRFKLARAQEHLVTLNNEVAAFWGRQPYGISYDREAEGTEHVFRVRVREPPPLMWSTIVGDCLQNMRSALDHLACQLVLKGSGSVKNSTAFPIFIDDPFASDAETWLRDRFRRNTDGMAREAITVVKELQPYNADDDADSHALWILNELARFDRHRELQVVGAVHQSTTFSLGKRNESGSFYSAPIPYVEEFFDDIRFGPFKDGAVVARFVWRPANPEMEVDLQTTFSIAFSESGPAPRFPVVETLDGILGYIYGTVFPRFEGFF
jgi:hypothetical protein